MSQGSVPPFEGSKRLGVIKISHKDLAALLGYPGATVTGLSEHCFFSENMLAIRLEGEPLRWTIPGYCIEQVVLCPPQPSQDGPHCATCNCCRCVAERNAKGDRFVTIHKENCICEGCGTFRRMLNATVDHPKDCGCASCRIKNAEPVFSREELTPQVEAIDRIERMLWDRVQAIDKDNPERGVLLGLILQCVQMRCTICGIKMCCEKCGIELKEAAA